MKDKTAPERALRANERRRKAGLVPVMEWVPSELKHSLKCYAELLRGNKTASQYVKENEK